MDAHGSELPKVRIGLRLQPKYYGILVYLGNHFQNYNTEYGITIPSPNFKKMIIRLSDYPITLNKHASSFVWNIIPSGRQYVIQLHKAYMIFHIFRIGIGIKSKTTLEKMFIKVQNLRQ